jgi:N utilization substance protein B
VTSRRQARRTALVVLYQWDVTGQPLASLYEGEVDPFARELAEGVAARAEALDRLISEASRGWPAGRLGALERNILRIALFELDRGEVPAAVALDEAVTLAKRYASEDAGRLVNGILGRLVETAPPPPSTLEEGGLYDWDVPEWLHREGYPELEGVASLRVAYRGPTDEDLALVEDVESGRRYPAHPRELLKGAA